MSSLNNFILASELLNSNREHNNINESNILSENITNNLTEDNIQ